MDLRENIKVLTPKNICSGILYEPRLLFDVCTFDGTQQLNFGNPDVFRNTERYPFHITHILAAMMNQDEDEASPPLGDERMVQRYGLTIIGHDTYYINPGTPDLPLLPLWHNVVSAASDIITLSQTTWDFMYPVEMGRRDTFQVEVQLIVPPETGDERVSVTFHGFGMLSKEPKILSGYIDLSSDSPGTIDTDFFRNDGLEPLMITKVTVNDQPPLANSNPTGNVRNVRMRIRQNGNGTQQWWSRGPIITAPNDRAPEPLWGITTGRAIIHKIPGGGWRWASGEGVNIKVQSYSPTRAETVLIAMAGYVEVTS